MSSMILLEHPLWPWPTCLYIFHTPVAVISVHSSIYIKVCLCNNDSCKCHILYRNYCSSHTLWTHTETLFYFSRFSEFDVGLFVWLDSLRPTNNLSVIKGRVFLGWTSTKLGLMFLLKDTTQWCRWGSNPRPFSLESSTLPLSHCAPTLMLVCQSPDTGFAQAWKVLEYTGLSWKVLENKICLEKYLKNTQRPWKVLEFYRLQEDSTVFWRPKSVWICGAFIWCSICCTK